MEKEKIVFGLDIGTTKIVCLAGKLNEFGKLEVVGVGRSKSLGVKRGIVNNIMQTVESINHAVKIVQDNYSLDVDVEGQGDYNFYFKVENLKLMPLTYDVKVSSKNISHFKSQTSNAVEYWIALEPESSYSE